MTPRVGVFLSTRLAGLGGDDDPAPFLAQAELAEATSFDSVWVGDSLAARPRLEPLTLLAALAARTRRVTLGTAVLLPALRHPLTAAHAIATIDRLSEGRLVVGVGSGFAYPGTERELGLVGVPMKERVGRVVESVAIWRKLWGSPAPVSHQGRYWSFQDVALTPRPERPGGPPIWMGGNAPAAVRRAAEIADGFFPTSATPDSFGAAWNEAAGAAGRAGRKRDALTSAVLLTVNVDHDGERARRSLRDYMESYYGASLDLLSTFIGCHAGTPAECAEWIGRYARAGARHVVLRFASPYQLEQMERAAAEVLPGLGAAKPKGEDR
jgi:alkanesulfonate monooxygenase SsuD/methylene tetrahydromethanopterin reductase-like flavin-dependent oxidoreductase (luciferase family)